MMLNRRHFLPYTGDHMAVQTVGHLCDILEDIEGKRPDHLDRLAYVVELERWTEPTNPGSRRTVFQKY